jgi:peptidoglycan/LPS O-acetylase OafA/YrhL
VWLVPVWMALGVFTNRFAPVALAPLAWGMAFFTLVNYGVFQERAGTWTPGRLQLWFAKVGVFSYSIYLVHHPVRGLVKRVLERFIIGGNLLVFIAANVVVVIAGYFAGRAFFALVERRFINHKA